MYILDCTAAEEMCTNLQPFLNVIKVLFGIVRWTVPIVLIVYGSIDMFKAVTKAEDEKFIQDARRSLIKRIIYGVVVFLVPLIVNIIMELIDEGVTTTDEVTATTWVSCWNNTIDTSKCDDIYAPEVEPETSSENGNTCNCEVCENGTSNCQYAKIAVEECRAEGGTCKPDDAGNACYFWTNYSCTTDGAKYMAKYGGCVRRYYLNNTMFKNWWLDSMVQSGIIGIDEIQTEDDFKNYIETKINSNVEVLPFLTDSAAKICDSEVGEMPKSVKFGLYPDNGDDKRPVIVCIYEKVEEQKFDSNKPSETSDGTYKVYTCKEHECNSSSKVLCSGGTTGTTGKQ